MDNTNRKKLRRNDQVEDDQFISLSKQQAPSKSDFYGSLADNIFSGQNGGMRQVQTSSFARLSDS